MSRSRKRRNSGPKQQPRGNRGRSRQKRKSRDKPGDFWGDSSKLPPVRQDVRITDDPAATVRSLGPPPLAGHEDIAEHYFAAVCDRAVTIAGALAAVGGLIEAAELQDRGGS